MYVYPYSSERYHYAYRTSLTSKRNTLNQELWFSGSGYLNMHHIKENYKIVFTLVYRSNVVDCSIYIPKWWGKFICMRNYQNTAGVPSGGGFFSGTTLMGIGCFELRVNDHKVFVFTDLRYYLHFIYHFTNIQPGHYYEYAYPQWSVKLFWIYDGSSNNPYIPAWQIRDDLYPYGKK